MVLKLYGVPISTCTRRVALVLKELNVPYEFVQLDFTTGDIKKPEFLERQPFGQVPAIDDDGFQLYESRAIGRYLVQKYGKDSTLVPTGDIQKIAKFEEAASIEQNNFEPFAAGIGFEKLAKKFLKLETNEAHVQFLASTLEAKLAVYDKILAKQKYLAGDELTLADLFHIPKGSLLELCGYDFLVGTKYPNVARWWKDISSRPSWQIMKEKLTA